MKSREIINLGMTILPELKHEVYWLVSHFTGLAKHELLLDDVEIAPEIEARLLSAVHKRKGGEPLQYITGVQPFMDLELLVDHRVLIPRWDSEVVVEKMLELLPEGEELVVADICTGSGTYALACKHYRPQAAVTAVDISEDALFVAKTNAERLCLDVKFLTGDLAAPLSGEFDLIVSNPPYIPTAEILNLSVEVRQEPELALDGGEDGLDFYRRLAADCPALLKTGGWLIVEIGHDQEEAVSALMEAAGLTEICSGRDYGNNPRWVAGRKA